MWTLSISCVPIGSINSVSPGSLSCFLSHSSSLLRMLSVLNSCMQRWAGGRPEANWRLEALDFYSNFDVNGWLPTKQDVIVCSAFKLWPLMLTSSATFLVFPWLWLIILQNCFLLRLENLRLHLDSSSSTEVLGVNCFQSSVNDKTITLALD